MTPSSKPEWLDVMAELRGLRLIIHDELLRKGSMDYQTLCQHITQADGIGQLLGALRWLAEHRLLVCEEGTWRAVHPGLARQQVEMQGIAEAPSAAATMIPARPPARGETAAVHRHQVEFFTQDGYRESNGSRD